MILRLAVVLHGALALPLCPNQQNSKDHVLLSALLPLHSGDDCSETRIRGVQQLAALDYGLGKVNADLGQYGDVKIALQVLDTCSNANAAVKATMKGLVSAEQTCVKSPLLLGYVGPDDLESFVNVHKITSLLNKTHVLPFKVDLKQRPSNVFFVGTDRTGVRAKAILTMLKSLGWENYMPVIENSVQTASLMEQLVNQPDERICPIQNPTVLPKTENGYASVYKEIAEMRTSVDGILVIAEKPDALKPLFDTLPNSAGAQRLPFVVYVISVGLKPWELPRSDSVKMVVMQEATDLNVKNEIKRYMNGTLMDGYREQTRTRGRDCENGGGGGGETCLDALEDELDSTVMPIVYSVHLFANALKISLDRKCKQGGSAGSAVCRGLQSMPAAEWTSLLRTASAIANVGPDGPKRVRFQMDTVHHVSVYARNTRKFELVGTMTNGDRLDFANNVFPPTSVRAVRSDRRPAAVSCRRSYAVKSADDDDDDDGTAATTAARPDDWSPIWDFLPNADKGAKSKDGYNAIVVMLCVGLGFLVFMVVTIRMLYNMFKFKQGAEEPSSGKKRGKRSARRNNKRSGSVMSRKLSRTGSITSARST